MTVTSPDGEVVTRCRRDMSAVRVLAASLTRGRRPAHVPRTSLSSSGSVTEWLMAVSR